MRTSPRGIAMIAAHEGIVPAPYLDVAGVWTYGIGHTRAAGSPDPSKMDREMPSSSALDRAIKDAVEVFKDDLVDYEQDVVEAFGSDLTQTEFDGLVSWHFNTGGAFTSSAVGKWRRGDAIGAAQTISSWNKITKNGRKVVSEALQRRRDEEVDLIIAGRYPTAPITVWGTNGRGRVIWEPIKVYQPSEFADMIAGPEAAGGAPKKPLVSPVEGIVGAVAIIAGLVLGFFEEIKSWLF